MRVSSESVLWEERFAAACSSDAERSLSHNIMVAMLVTNVVATSPTRMDVMLAFGVEASEVEIVSQTNDKYVLRS